MIVSCYSWAPSDSDHSFTCGAISWLAHNPFLVCSGTFKCLAIVVQHGVCWESFITYISTDGMFLWGAPFTLGMVISRYSKATVVASG